LEQQCDNPITWPIVFGLALQEVIVEFKDSLNPDIAFLIAMETAIPMSKLDPDRVITA
jgi:hypothetical protein